MHITKFCSTDLNSEKEKVITNVNRITFPEIKLVKLKQAILERQNMLAWFLELDCQYLAYKMEIRNQYYSKSMTNLIFMKIFEQVELPLARIKRVDKLPQWGGKTEH